jgi:hypothetical protein
MAIGLQSKVATEPDQKQLTDGKIPLLRAIAIQLRPM